MKEYGVFLFGFVFGMAVVFLVFIAAPLPNSLAKDLRQECEQSLPRDQACIMQYIPEARP